MSRSLKLFIAWLVGISVVALVLTSFVFASDPGRVLGLRPEIAIDYDPRGTGLPGTPAVVGGILLWLVITLFAGALPVRMPHGTQVSVSIAPIVAAMCLGGPVAAGWIALLGTFEGRELRGRIPWYGTAANHAGLVLPAVIAGLAYEGVRGPSNDPLITFLATMVGAVLFFFLNFGITSIVIALRTEQSMLVVLV